MDTLLAGTLYALQSETPATTENAAAAPPTSTFTIQPTVPPTATPKPFLTFTPTVLGAPPCNAAKFVSDVTIPDD
jgi:hypothetical protein